MESTETDEKRKKKVSSLLTTCYICKRTYRNPKVLSCYHTFCESCLQESVPGQGLSLHCFICGHQSILPKEGVGELRSNPYIKRIMLSVGGEEDGTQDNVTDVSELHANLATEKNIGPSEPRTQTTAIFNDMRCNSHCDKPVAMYCQSCDMVVCTKCAKLEHVEHYDAITSLENVSSNCEEALLKQADALEQKISPLQKAVCEITQLISALESSKDIASKNIMDGFNGIEDTLHQRRDDLMQKVLATYDEKLSKLTEQLTDIKMFVGSMEDGLDVIVQSLAAKTKDSSREDEKSPTNERTIPDTGAFFLHRQISKTIDDLCKYKLNNESKPSSLVKEDSTSTVSEHSVRLAGGHGTQTYQAPVKLTVPCENTHIRVENMQDIGKLRHLISNLGSVETSSAIAQKSSLSGEALTTEVCKAGCENSIVLTAKTWSGELETSGKVVIEAKMEYLGPDDKQTSVTPRDVRSPTFKRPSSVILRKSVNVVRTPRPLSGTRFTTSSPIKQTTARKQKPISTASATVRSPLKDIFSSPNQELKTTPGTTTPSSQGSDPSEAPITSARIDYIRNGAYEITFIPRDPGKYSLSVEMYGKEMPHGKFILSAQNPTPISNGRLRTRRECDVPMTPQSVRQKGMKRPPSSGPKKNPIEDDLIQKVGARGRGKGEFSNPQGVSTDHLGRLLVADSTNQCIQVFSTNSKKAREPKYLFKFGERGRGTGQVQRPTGVCGLPDSDIAVSDYDNKVVKIFAEDGSFKHNIGSGKLMGPKGLCLDRNGHLVVVDNKLCQIFVFQLNGKLVTKFGTRGTEPHQLAGPHFIAVNNENSFYISDFYNHCVKIFTPRGKCISVIGSLGEGCGQFNAPTGLAIDQRGNLIVADWGNSRLQVFDKRGSFLTYINTSEDPLYGPQGVTLIHEDQVAAADSGNQCVKIYRYLQ